MKTLFYSAVFYFWISVLFKAVEVSAAEKLKRVSLPNDFCIFKEKDLEFLQLRIEESLANEQLTRVLLFLSMRMTNLNQKAFKDLLNRNHVNFYSFAQVCKLPNKNINQWVIKMLVNTKNERVLASHFELFFDGSHSMKRNIPFHFRNFNADKEAKMAILEIAPYRTDREKFDNIMKQGGAFLEEFKLLEKEEEKLTYVYRYHNALLILNAKIGIPDNQKVVVAVFKKNKLVELR
jgi:hypothetical protein